MKKTTNWNKYLKTKYSPNSSSNHIMTCPCCNETCSLSQEVTDTKNAREIVLILVVMEDALWATKGRKAWRVQGVLILVVMEDALWEICLLRLSCRRIVLILVVMEHTLRGKRTLKTKWELISLNPCCNGRYSPSDNRKTHISQHNQS